MAGAEAEWEDDLAVFLALIYQVVMHDVYPLLGVLYAARDAPPYPFSSDHVRAMYGSRMRRGMRMSEPCF